MNSTKFLASILLISTFYFSCCTTKTLTNNEVEKKLGKNFLCKENSDAKYFLCTEENPQSNSFQYLIYDAEADSIIHRETFSGGSAVWINDHQVKVEIIPGAITGDESADDFIFIYDVKLKKKIKQGD